MVVVQNRVKDVSGDGIGGVTVTASLASPGYLDDGTIISSVSTTSAATTGLWSLDLPPNTDINPAGTHYRIREAGRTSAIVVPDSAGPLEMVDLLVSAPEDPDSVTVGVTSVDGRDGIVTLSDLYAALAHASRHASGGADPLTDVIFTNASNAFSNWDDFIASIDQADDSATEPNTSLWPDRFELRFRGQLVQWWNEFMEWRGVPAYPANDGTGVGTVGWRLFAALNETAYNARSSATPVWSIVNYRSGSGSGEELASLNHLGEFSLVASDWTGLSLGTGVIYGTNAAEVRIEHSYRVVRMRGGILNNSGGTIASGTTLATVPSGFRPAQPMSIPVRTRDPDAMRELTINSDGTIVNASGTDAGSEILLDAITWTTDG